MKEKLLNWLLNGLGAVLAFISVIVASVVGLFFRILPYVLLALIIYWLWMNWG